MQPNKTVELKTIFIQMIGSDDLSYQFDIIENFPAFQFKEEKDLKLNKKINANFTIQTQSPISRLIAPFLNEQLKNSCVYKIKYGQFNKSAEIEFRNYNYNFNIQKEDNNIFRILFRTINMNEPIIYSQYNPEKKETAYSINYTYISKNLKYIPCSMKPDEDNTLSYINIYEKYEDNIMNETPGLFIFLLDISGSMSGEALFLAKNALLLFIQSLPKESYFQIIGFYQYYNTL